MQAKWERMSGVTDSQEVGLEAAILERVRNSSLVESPGADNSTGLKPVTEAVDVRLRSCMVGERRLFREGVV